MLLVFGGTTEGKKVVDVLGETAYTFWYSTKTQTDIDLPVNGRYRFGAFDPGSLAEFCREQQVQVMIHASHPFAGQLHTTISEVSLALGIPVIRFERHYPERIKHPLIQYVEGYEKALDWLQSGVYEPVLALTGVQSIAKLQAYWKFSRMLFRILPRASSLAIAAEIGFPERDLIRTFPAQTVEEEVAVIRQTGARAMLTKESGESGFLSVKIAAALETGVPLCIICRPALPPHFLTVQQADELITTLQTLLYGSATHT
jgi:precorrin-6x reductase